LCKKSVDFKVYHLNFKECLSAGTPGLEITADESGIQDLQKQGIGHDGGLYFNKDEVVTIRDGLNHILEETE